MRAKKLVPKQINKIPINNSSKKTPHSPNPKLITPTETHLVSLIHSSKNSQELQQLHTQVIKHNHSSNSWVVTQLISSYSLHKSVSYAVRIFSYFQNPNLFVFNALIRALTDHSCFERSVMYFVCMVRRNVRPDRLTYPFVLKSVGGLGEGGVGSTVHGEVVKRGCEFDSFVRVSLVDMYVRVELLECGLKLFEESPEGNKMGSVLLWNVLVNGCCKVGALAKAVEIFEAMPVRNVGSWNCLINGLLRHGEVDRAVEFFCLMPERNVVSWTMMVSGFSHNGCFREALGMFSRMLIEGVRPNELSFVSVLLACAKAGAIDTGVRIHCYAWRSGFQLDSAVGTALIEMYAKCGFIKSASRVFDMTKYKDIRTWTAIIWGSAIHGCFEQAIVFFQKMKLAGVKPDGIVFLAILTACSHAGQVEWGLHYFDCMKSEYSIKPTIKHYAVVVDLFGRAGQLDEAFSFVQNMPLVPDLVIWGALFCACRAHKNIKMAEYASQRLLELETQHPGNYVFLSNVYAGVGRWEDVERVRSSMKDTGLEKEPGWSYIEVGGQVHSFVAGDHSHDRAEELYMKLDEIASSAREQGYMPETEWILHNIEEEEKEESLGSHSEKLALAFALISTTPGTTIRIVKNLRVCGDCHSFMKYVSKMSWRQILLRDNKRFHHFRDGTCSCGDYW